MPPDTNGISVQMKARKVVDMCRLVGALLGISVHLPYPSKRANTGSPDRTGAGSPLRCAPHPTGMLREGCFATDPTRPYGPPSPFSSKMERESPPLPQPPSLRSGGASRSQTVRRLVANRAEPFTRELIHSGGK
jgi:hypothetical protein